MLACEKAEFDPKVLRSSSPLEASPLLSELQISGATVADGVSLVYITVILKSDTGQAVPGVTVQVTVSGTGNNLTACPVTNSQGQTSCHFDSTWPETKTVTATVMATTNFVIKKDVVLSPVNYSLNAADVSIGGGYYTQSSGNRLIMTAGSPFSPHYILDSSLKLRLHTSILGMIKE